MIGETASAWVFRWAQLVAPGASVLDVACGGGRHAKLFAARGCHVTAIDREASLAATFKDDPNIRFIAADFESSPTDHRSLITDHQFHCIVVTNYLHRPLFPALHSALAPGGLLVYETFAAGNAAFGKPSNPDYLLQPRELLEAFGPQLRVLAFEDGFSAQPKPAMVQRIAARKGEPRAVLPPEQCYL